MSNVSHTNLQNRASVKTEVDLKEIVMGLHWHPPVPGAVTNAEPANLDAQCVLLDAQQRVLEVVHPGHPRNVNDSVLHTGDSRTGASEWDDERIFVFLEALPETVSTLVFVVSSPSGRAFGDIPGARCHVSDRVTEHAWVQFELTTLTDQREYSVATLHRGSAGWEISSGAPELIYINTTKPQTY